MTAFGVGMRPSFFLDPKVTYLNHGAFGAVPRAVVAAQDTWRAQMEVEPVEFFLRTAPAALEVSRARAATFLNARPENLVFVENTSTAVSAVLGSLPLGPGDEVVTTSHAYPGVMRALEHQIARTGAHLVIADIPHPVDHPDQVVAAVGAALNHKTRLLLIDWITSATGLVFPVHQIVAQARAIGVPVFVDGAHAPGQVTVDLADLDADWWCGNLHKWAFAPRGCAVLWAREGRQDLHPAVIGHQYGRGWHAEFAWTGTRDCTPFLAVPEVLDFVESVGMDAMVSYNRALCTEAAEMLAHAWGQQRLSADAMRANMATLALDGPGDPALALTLRDYFYDEHQLEVPCFAFAGRLWLRISAQIYNDIGQYEQLLRALPETYRP